MINHEQWIKDHESSFTGSDRLEPAEQVKHMTDAELDDSILNARSGVVVLARKERDRRKGSRLHANLAKAIKAYTDNTCDNPLYGASAEARTMGIA